MRPVSDLSPLQSAVLVNFSVLLAPANGVSSPFRNKRQSHVDRNHMMHARMLPTVRSPPRSVMSLPTFSTRVSVAALQLSSLGLS